MGTQISPINAKAVFRELPLPSATKDKSMISSERIDAWQSGKCQQRMEQGTLGYKGWWKFWVTEKFVRTGLALAGGEAQTSAMQNFLTIARNVRCLNTTLFPASWRVTKADFITLIRKQNDRARKGIIQHRQRKRSRKQHPQLVRPWELFAGILKDAHWSSFYQQRKRRCCSLSSDAPQVISCTTRHKRHRTKTTTQVHNACTEFRRIWKLLPTHPTVWT